jgi:hypothetical protein
VCVIGHSDQIASTIRRDLGTIVFSMFLMLTLYMQQVLGYSPLRTGLAYPAFVAGAGAALVGVLVAIGIVRRRDLAATAPQPALEAA